MSEKEENHFSFDVDSTNELTEEIYIFPKADEKRKNIIFIIAVTLASAAIIYISYQFGARLNVDQELLPQIYTELKDADVTYIEESATRDTLLTEKETLTQELLRRQSETGQLDDYSINRETLGKKVEELKAEYEEIKKEVDDKKKQIAQTSEDIYTLTLNPGVYSVGANIPAAIFEVKGNGSIIASSAENEMKINEKLSKETPITLELLDGYTVKVTTITTFTLKE